MSPCARSRLDGFSDGRVGLGVGRARNAAPHRARCAANACARSKARRMPRIHRSNGPLHSVPVRHRSLLSCQRGPAWSFIHSLSASLHRQRDHLLRIAQDCGSARDERQRAGDVPRRDVSEIRQRVRRLHATNDATPAPAMAMRQSVGSTSGRGSSEASSNSGSAAIATIAASLICDVQRLGHPPLRMSTGRLPALHAHSIRDIMSRRRQGY